MALIAFEGFDFYDTTGTDLTARGMGAIAWTSFTGSFGNPGRAGSGSYLSVVSASLLMAAAIASGFIGFAVQAFGTDVATINVVDNLAGAVQLAFKLNQTLNRIDVYLGGAGAPFASTATNGIIVTAWNYLEIGVTIHPTAGAVTLRCNGQTVLALSGINTRATVNSSFNGVNFASNFSTTLNIDDLYLADTTPGPGVFAFDNFAGDLRVVTLNTIGAGSSTQWTPLANANWQEVSEVHNTGDASYNASSTPGQTDLFHFAALAGTISSVLAVQITGSYRKDDAGTREITQQLLSGTTQIAGATYSVPGTYVYLTDLFVLDPNTSTNWTVTSVNALQAGYTLTA